MGTLSYTTAQINTALAEIVGNNVVITDANGDIVANIVPRHQTLAVLESTQGAAGELASASDADVVYKFSGSPAFGGVQFDAATKPLGGVTTDIAYLSCQMDIALYGNSQVNRLAFTTPIDADPAQAGSYLVGLLDAGQNLIISRDGVNFFPVDVNAGANTPSFATDGKRLIKVEDGNTASYFSDSPYTSWAAYTTPLHATITSWTSVVMCGKTTALTADYLSSGNVALLDTTSNAVTLKTFPAGRLGCYKFFTPDALQTSSIFSIGIEEAGLDGLGVVLSGATRAAAVFTAITLPTTLADKVYFSGKYAIVSNNIDTLWWAEFNEVAGTIGAWSSKVFSAGILKIDGNPQALFVLDNNGGVWSSTSMVNWVKTPLSFVSSSIVCVESGVLAEGGDPSEGAFISNYKTVTSAPNFSTSAAGKQYRNSLLSPFYGLVLTIGRSVTKRSKSLSTTTITTFNAEEACEYLAYNGAAQTTLAYGLPPNPTPGFRHTVRFKNAITGNTTFSPKAAPTGQTITGASTLVVAGITAGTVKTFVYMADGDWAVI